MFAYSVRRILASVPVLLLASVLVFWLVSFSRDPVRETFGARNPPVPREVLDAEYERLGLKDSFFEQYWQWLQRLVWQQDFGPSIVPNMSINSEIGERLMATLRLILFAVLVSLVLAVVTGVLSAVRQYSKSDYAFTFLGFVLLSMPVFWVAVLLKQAGVLFNEATGTRYVYTFGERSQGVDLTGMANVLDIAGHLVLPTLSLALLNYAALSRFQRGSMLEVLDSDYIRLARAKGLRRWPVLIRHGLRTALIPMTTASGLLMGGLIGGAVVTESVYGWNGMGKLLIDAIRIGDRNVIMAWLLLAGFFVVLFNLIADLLYAVLDPKIRYE